MALEKVVDEWYDNDYTGGRGGESKSGETLDKAGDEGGG
jgi:hypothetical protein